MIIKWLANFGVAGAAIAVLVYLFFFKVMPWLIGNYRQVTKRGRDYEKEIDKINTSGGKRD